MLCSKYLLPKIWMVVLLSLSLPAVIHAQRYWNDVPFGKGDNTLALGVGFGLDFGNTPAATDRPAYSIAFDHGAAETGIGTISVGGILGYKSVQHNYSIEGYTAGWTHLIAGVRSALHVSALSNAIPNLDPYAGVMMGVRIWNAHDDYVESMGFGMQRSGERVISGPFLGLRYNFGQAVGVWTEVGYDVAFVKGGLHVNF